MNERSQPVRGPSQPDDVRNYDAGSFVGQILAFFAVAKAYPMRFLDSQFRIQDNGDTTKQLAFEVGGFTTATTRTLTPPDRSAQIVTTGTNAFPTGVTGDVYFRTDKKCWYYYDGTNWNVVGVEQSVRTSAAPVQTINSTTPADVTSSSISVTTLGAGIITIMAMVRASVTAGGTLQVFASINSNTTPQLSVTNDTSTNSMPVVDRVAVSAAGTYTVKLQASMAAGATSASITSFVHVVEVIGGV